MTIASLFLSFGRIHEKFKEQTSWTLNFNQREKSFLWITDYSETTLNGQNGKFLMRFSFDTAEITSNKVQYLQWKR